MTAIRVIDDHEDLDNVGSNTHQQLDNYIDHTRWILAPGSNPVPPSALTINAGDGIEITTGVGQLIVSNSALNVGNMSGVAWRLMETPTGIIDGVNVQYALSGIPQPVNSLMLFVNGILQEVGIENDYTLSGNIVTLVKPLVFGSKITAAYSCPSSMGVVWCHLETPSGDIDDSNVTFTLSNAPYPSHVLMLFVNGVLQVQGAHADYVLSGNVITLTTPPLAKSKVVATYAYLTMGTRVAWMEQPVGDVDSINMIYELKYLPSPSNTLMLFVNGVLQKQNEDYFLTGKEVMLYDAPPDGSNLSAIYQY